MEDEATSVRTVAVFRAEGHIEGDRRSLRQIDPLNRVDNASLPIGKVRQHIPPGSRIKARIAHGCKGGEVVVI